MSRPAKGFPDFKTSEPDVWRPFFAKSKPHIRDVQRHVMYLNEQQQHEHVIALLNAAIIEGQAQPWMYEVLAVTMELAQKPKEEIERVVLSVADFGNASFDSMIYSGAYLRNFGRDAAAIRMFRQAARMAPDRPEPYVLCMKLAPKTGDADDAIWSACGVLRTAWGVDRQKLHDQAEDLLIETERQLLKAQQTEKLGELKAQATEARRRDLTVQIQWNGTGDLDLSVEDPSGGVASFESRDTAGGGCLLNDGFGPQPENCHEDFVCPVGFTGEYVLTVTKASGKIVGNRAVVTIMTHAGSPAEKKVIKTLTLDETNQQVIRISLEDGRREQRRAVMLAKPLGVARDWERLAAQGGRPAQQLVDPEVKRAVAQLRESRRQGIQQAVGQFGGLGFAPVISIIPEGASLAARAVVSADRRYVRIALSPSFNQIVDVAVFTFQGR